MKRKIETKNKNKPKIKIYSGYSLLKEDVSRSLPGAVLAPPIKTDDLLQDMRDGFQIIGIVDGHFYQTRAVSPMEIVDALRCGLKIFGSSSMGALRAVELESVGMIGVGEIFDYIKRHHGFNDDFLGQVFFDDGEASIPFIEVLMFLEKLRGSNHVHQRQVSRATELAKEFHFSSFSAEKFMEDLKSDPLFRNVPKSLFSKRRQRFGQKRTDGVEMLQQISRYVIDINRFNGQT